MGERLYEEDFVRSGSTTEKLTHHNLGDYVLNGIKEISGDFPAIQSKTTYFYVFRANRRNFSVYLSIF